MANLKEIRIRISSTISTQQITKAMKLVSATKLRKAQGGIMQMRPYANKLFGMLANLAGSVEDESLAKYFDQRETKKLMLVVLTSDRGLCGAFNSNVIKKTRSLLENKYAHLGKENITLLCIGKKGSEFFGKMGYKVDNRFRELFQNLNADTAFEAGNYVFEAFLSGQYDRVDLVYNQFKNAATQILQDEQYLPVDMEEMQGNDSNVNYIFEPGKVEILNDLIPRALKTKLYRALLDSFASEHGARMVAMDKATENAGELLKSLKLTYNQARQAAITNEISEIVGGAAALE
ncbi:MAG: ATP synthase F1 subunit gamma [Bacteroidetes bacterium]|nr:MAG: ATP synthase F1 subunit gamma [Bacteroidota bacterium]